MVRQGNGGHEPCDRLIGAIVTRLKTQPHTRVLGAYIERAVRTLRAVERASSPWDPDDRAEVLLEVADSHADQLLSLPKGARVPGGRLPDLRNTWETLTPCVAGVLATAPKGGGRVSSIRAGLQEVWREILGQTRPLPVAVIDRALAGDKRTPRNIAFILLCHVPGNLAPRQDPEDLRRSLKEVKVRPAW